MQTGSSTNKGTPCPREARAAQWCTSLGFNFIFVRFKILLSNGNLTPMTRANILIVFKLSCELATSLDVISLEFDILSQLFNLAMPTIFLIFGKPMPPSLFLEYSKPSVVKACKCKMFLTFCVTAWSNSSNKVMAVFPMTRA